MKMNILIYKLKILIVFSTIFVACQPKNQVKEEGRSLSLQSKSISSVWVSDNGDGTYTNPILQADYSDPDVIRAGDDFYMTASSFNSSPGLPILHSIDLVNWQIVNYALPVFASGGI